MGRRLSPEAKILNLYDDLSEDGKRIVYDLLRAKQPKRTASKKSSTARRAGAKSSPKTGAQPSTADAETPKDAATDATGGDDE